mgnify:CR=1 FL=1
MTKVGFKLLDASAYVTAGRSPMITENQVVEAVDAAGHIDVLVANFAHPPVTGALEQLKSDDWTVPLCDLCLYFPCGGGVFMAV